MKISLPMAVFCVGLGVQCAAFGQDNAETKKPGKPDQPPTAAPASENSPVPPGYLPSGPSSSGVAVPNPPGYSRARKPFPSADNAPGMAPTMPAPNSRFRLPEGLPPGGEMRYAPKTPGNARVAPVKPGPKVESESDFDLENGLFEEDANFNLPAAIRAYQRMVNRFDNQRKEAAIAVFRLGECYRKMGRMPEARKQYERILNEFADQARLVQLSQEQLGGEGRGTESEARPRTTRGRLSAGPEENAPSAIGNLLNIDMAGTGAVGPAAFGIDRKDYWNGFAKPWDQVVQLDHLKWYDGTETPVSLTVSNCAGNWGNKTGNAMYDGYVYPNNPAGDGVGNIVATLKNLPPGSYDFYLYGHADSGGRPEQDGIFTLNVGDHQFGPKGTLASDGWKATQPWVEGKQYILFRNVEVERGQSVVITVSPGFNGEPANGTERPAVFNGMQVASRVPAAPRFGTSGRRGPVTSEGMSARREQPAPMPPVEVIPARFEATVFEVQVPENRIADLDAEALGDKTATAQELAKLLADFGKTKILYKIDQTVNLLGERITLGTSEPVITGSRTMASGQAINSVSYRQVGLMVGISASVPPGGTKGKDLDTTVNFDLAAITDSGVDIGPNLKAPGIRNVSINHGEKLRLGKPTIQLRVSAGGGEKSLSTAYVVRYVFSAIPTDVSQARKLGERAGERLETQRP